MQDIWNRINTWIKANVPEIQNDLLPGATEEEIQAVEKHLKIKFPQDIKISYQIHNGQAGDDYPLMGIWELLSLEDIVSQWDIMQELLEKGEFDNVEGKPIGPVKADWWNSKWIPIADNGGGDLICLDLDPAEGGEVGQIIYFWHMEPDREKIAANFRAWLQEYVNALESGKYVAENGELVMND